MLFRNRFTCLFGFWEKLRELGIKKYKKRILYCLIGNLNKGKRKKGFIFHYAILIGEKIVREEKTLFL